MTRPNPSAVPPPASPNFHLGKSLPSPDGLGVADQLASLAALMGVRRYALLVAGQSTLYLETADPESLAAGFNLPRTHPFSRALLDGGRQPYPAAGFWRSPAAADWENLWQGLTWADLLVPLELANEEITAVLLLGPRASSYSPTDLQLLGLVARQIVLLDVQSAMGSLARALVLAADANRRNVANLLHDDLLQILFLVKQNLFGIQHRPDESPGLSADAIHLLEEGITHIRMLIDMQQPMLLERGLLFGLQRLARQAAEAGQPVAFSANVEPEAQPALTPAQTLGVFRVAEEALSNAIHHSQAAAIRLDLTRDTAGLHLTVSDDGVGFEYPHKGDRLGITSMRTRARLMEAELSLESAPGQGAILVLTLPARLLEAPQ